MKLSKIEFNGFKRFANASCNVDGRTVAFIGPNESGKSSVLEGLSWLTSPDASELVNRDLNRQHPPGPHTSVVRAIYRIDDGDLATLMDLNLDVVPPVSKKTVTEFRISRTNNGSIRTGIESSVRRNPKPFKDTKRKLLALKKALVTVSGIIELEEAATVLEQALEDIDPENGSWDEARRQRIRDTLVELRAIQQETDEISARSSKLVRFQTSIEVNIYALQEALAAGEQADPNDAFRHALEHRVPRFVIFSDEDRDISESYGLSDESLRADPPSPLRNLLAVANTSVDEVWAAYTGGDMAILRSLEYRMNEALRDRLQPMWTQSELAIRVTLNQGGVLEVNIHELDSPGAAITPIAERSDGLRTFLGLVSFLIAANLPIPPVVLIDEAERNLHYDAQADLVRVLTRELNVHKVIYTTHSPGCLPFDLGTGIRVVRRDPANPAVSILENTFWTKDEPEFSHLLFAMGAEAAAFSAFRKAVLTEGASDMILLPTLLRNATGGEDLGFQVAFGLSNMSVPHAMGSIALVTTFLLDGDGSGNTKRKQLLSAGVPRDHIFQLPKGKAIEDLVKRDTYLNVVNEFLEEIVSARIPKQALHSGIPIATAVDAYTKQHFGLPSGVSHKIIATRLAELGDDLPLSAHGKRYLSDLRDKLRTAFSQPYTITPSRE